MKKMRITVVGKEQVRGKSKKTGAEFYSILVYGTHKKLNQEAKAYDPYNQPRSLVCSF